MTLVDVDNIINKIKIFRPSFGSQIDMKSLKVEWFRILEPYDFKDVNIKLNEFFNSLDNDGKYPNPYYLIKFLKTKKEKQYMQEYKVQCKICYKYVPLSEYDTHFDRCLVTEAVIRDMKQYFNKEISKEDLEALSDDVLHEKYMILVRKKKDILPEGYRKDLLKVILGEMPAIELGKNLQPVEVVKRFW